MFNAATFEYRGALLCDVLVDQEAGADPAEVAGQIQETRKGPNLEIVDHEGRSMFPQGAKERCHVLPEVGRQMSPHICHTASGFSSGSAATATSTVTSASMATVVVGAS
jgi:hypothetical protein